MNEPVVIRSCHELTEFHACVALQREIWGEDPLEVEPTTAFVVAAHTGGQVIGAFAGESLVGFVLALAAVREGQPYLHSHMAGISAAYQNQGIGRKLKLFQREEALQRGITLIEWTFDPLELRNAHFNLNRLGAICRKYLPNFYGVTTSPLHRGLRTDRLLAEWHLEAAKAIAAVDGLDVGAVNPGSTGLNVPGSEATRIAVPGEVPYGVGGDVSSTTALQDRLRDEFTERFAEGFHAVAINIDPEPSYILVKPQRTAQRGNS
jgi:predicted GNAT superfamily acetyltransferase